ncbi:MAG: GC-type dockerin domain-anchored protein [Phycisphaerales bacterium]
MGDTSNRRLMTLACCALGIAGVAESARAQAPEPPLRGVFCELQRQEGSYVRRPDHFAQGDVLVYEQKGWVLAWSFDGEQNLTFYDASKPTQLVRRATLEFPDTRGSSAEAAMADGDLAVALIDRQGLHVIDLSDPDAPRLRGLLPITNPGSFPYIHGFVDGRVLAFWGSSTQVRVVDVRDPDAPVIEATWPPDIFIARLDGDRTYTVRDGHFLTVLDISDPTTPVELGRLELDDATDAARLAATPDGIAYVPQGSWSPPYSGGYLIVDMSDPADMRVVGSLDVGVKGVPRIIGDRLYVTGLNDADEFIGLIYDISEPTTPLLLGTAARPWYTLGEGALYVSSERSISAIDVSAFPLAQTTHEVADLGEIRGLASKDDTLYVSAEPDRLLVFDATDPTSPMLIRELTATAGALATHGNTLVVGSRADGLLVYDVADARDPVAVGSLDMPAAGDIYSVDVRWPLATTVGRSSGLRVIDLTDRAAPRLAWTGEPTSHTWTTNAMLIGSHAYVLWEYDDGRSWSTHMTVYDLSVPDAPGSVLQRRMPYRSSRLFMNGGRFWAGGSEGFIGMDVTNPGSPALLGEYQDQPFGSMLLMERNYLHSPYGGVMDLRNPSNPRYRPTIPPEYPRLGIDFTQVTKVGEQMFLGDDIGTLYRVDLRECLPCLVDLDGDGALTIFDFLAFQNLFDAGDAIADFDGDGELTIFDFLAFQNAFDAGCP